MRLIILSEIHNKSDKNEFFITLYDVETSKSLYHVTINDEELIGRMITSLYKFVGGHMYFGNNVIKMRYDQIDLDSSK